MLRTGWRQAAMHLNPFGRWLHRLGLTPIRGTVISLILGAGVSMAAAFASLRLAAFMLVLVALVDALDGPIMRASGRFRYPQREVFFDALGDRIVDILLFGGVTWHLIANQPGWRVMLTVSVLAVSQLIYFERIQAGDLGVVLTSGLMERSGRYIALVLGLSLPGALIPSLWVMLVMSTVTFMQHAVLIWRQTVSEEQDLYPSRAARRGRLRKERRAIRRGRAVS